jgi:His/Glu/Gln/Arg/opine family amino acid ABC transporter permease subunit
MGILSFDDSGYGDELMAGLLVTISLAVLGFVLALALGVVLGVMALSHNRLMRAFWRTYASIFMGVPTLLIILFLFYNAPTIVKAITTVNFNPSPFSVGVASLCLVYAAYVGEVVRGAVLNIPVGQFEAARALGIHKLHLWWFVILPQAWRIALPGCTNVWMALLKDTALVSLVGLTDVVRMAYVASGATKMPFLFYAFAGLSFIVFSGVTMLGAERFERWVGRGQERAKGF